MGWVDKAKHALAPYPWVYRLAGAGYRGIASIRRFAIRLVNFKPGNFRPGKFEPGEWQAPQWVRTAQELASYRHALAPGAGLAQDADRNLVVMLVVSTLRIDPRVERAARTMVGAGYRVKIIWPDASQPYHSEQPIDWGPGIQFQPLPWQDASFIMNFPWLFGAGMHAAASREKPFAFHCHDLTTAAIGLSAARRVGAYCLCDFHEWYSENVSWDAAGNAWVPHPPFKRFVYRLVERLAMWRADAVITVCDSIAHELSATLSLRHRPVAVVRNIPRLGVGKPYPPLREQLGVADDCFVLLWQGGTGPSRMIEPIIEALALSPRTVFVIRGPSLDLFGAGYREVARKAGVESRLILVPPVPSADVVSAAMGADAGIWTLPNLSKNFYYALPNKIFEYMASGLPVLAAHFPEARAMVEGNRVGLCFDPYDPASIAAAINRLIDDRALLASFRARVPLVLGEIDPEREWGKLAAIYADLKSGRPA